MPASFLASMVSSLTYLPTLLKPENSKMHETFSILYTSRMSIISQTAAILILRWPYLHLYLILPWSLISVPLHLIEVVESLYVDTDTTYVHKYATDTHIAALSRTYIFEARISFVPRFQRVSFDFLLRPDLSGRRFFPPKPRRMRIPTWPHEKRARSTGI